MLIKKKYEKIECSNNHVFSIDYDGVIKKWNCVVMEKEVVAYERSKETARIKITNPEVAPHVIQVDTVVNIYGEEIPFQVENGYPFIKLEGEWVASDTFTEAKREAAIKMYQRNSKQEAIMGGIMLAVMVAAWLINGTMGDWWILSVFGIFFLSSAAFRLVRLRNELMAIQEAEAEAAREAEEPEEDAIAAARALKSGKTEE
jgi:hypothetical protein